jgi:RNA polymerase sigma-70 factor (ECF subfamily)
MWPPSPEALTDEALLAAVSLGDEAAATTFVRRFQRRVYGLALSVTFDADLAEDIAQAAFERAWRHAGSYDPRRGGVTTWLLAITRNLAIDSLRVRRPRPTDPSAVAAMLPPSRAPDPGEAASDGDRFDRLRRSLDRLPLEQRRAVLLATVGCRSSTEIAEIEGVPVPTAKHRVQAGLRKLRQGVRSEVDS